MKPNSNNRDGSEDSGGCSTGAVLDGVVDVPVVDGVHISVSKHSDSNPVHWQDLVCSWKKCQKTHDGMLASSLSGMG